MRFHRWLWRIFRNSPPHYEANSEERLRQAWMRDRILDARISVLEGKVLNEHESK